MFVDSLNQNKPTWDELTDLRVLKPTGTKEKENASIAGVGFGLCTACRVYGHPFISGIVTGGCVFLEQQPTQERD